LSEINPPEQTWNNLKIHFATTYFHHKQMQGETAAAYWYANAAMTQPADDDLTGSAIDTVANLATSTAVDRSSVATLTDANSRLAKQLEETSQTLKEIIALLKKDRNDGGSRKPFAPSLDNYCWTPGYKIARNHTSESCMYPKTGHKREATKKKHGRISS
jgi:hypothetical protein